MASPVCQLHSKSATAVCLSHGKFLCTTCLLEKEDDSCRKHDLAEIKDVKEKTQINFLLTKQSAAKKEEHIKHRLVQIDKEHEYLMQRVKDDRDALIKDINEKAATVLKGIDDGSRKLKSKYEKYLQEINQKTQLIETDMEIIDSDNIDMIKSVQTNIDMMNKELGQTYIVRGTVVADFEITKTIKETLKNVGVLGDVLFTEEDEYEKIAGEENKAFAEDDSNQGNPKESKRLESTVYKDVSRGSVMYDDTNAAQKQTGKEHKTIEIKAQAARYQNKDKTTKPSISSGDTSSSVPPRAPLKFPSKENGKSSSRCCCN